MQVDDLSEAESTLYTFGTDHLQGDSSKNCLHFVNDSGVTQFFFHSLEHMCQRRQVMRILSSGAVDLWWVGPWNFSAATSIFTRVLAKPNSAGVWKPRQSVIL